MEKSKRRDEIYEEEEGEFKVVSLFRVIVVAIADASFTSCVIVAKKGLSTRRSCGK